METQLKTTSTNGHRLAGRNGNRRSVIATADAKQEIANANQTNEQVRQLIATGNEEAAIILQNALQAGTDLAQASVQQLANSAGETTYERIITIIEE